jgi:Phage integrase, N-terminal SAM-like domain
MSPRRRVESLPTSKRAGTAETAPPRHQEASPDATTTVQSPTLADAARLLRDAMKNKGYRAFPLGQEAGAYLRQNRGRLLPNTYKTYESCLDKLARHFADKELRDFEPPMGTEWLEEFIDDFWGDQASRTRAKNISIIKGFFEWAVLRGKLHGDPARPIRPPKKRGVERTTFSVDQEQAIFAQNERRDRVALHLLLKVGIRKGAVQRVVPTLRPRVEAPDDLHQGRQGADGAGGRPGLLERARAAHPRLGSAAKRLPALPAPHDPALGLTGAEAGEASA